MASVVSSSSKLENSQNYRTMKLEIDLSSSQNEQRSIFEVQLGFYAHDDSVHTEVHSFTDAQLRNAEFKEELEQFIICITACIDQDSRGRGGFEDNRSLAAEYSEIPYWNKFVVPSALEKFESEEELAECFELDMEEVDEMLDRTLNFDHELPTYGHEGFYCSYRTLEVFYYDEDGTRFNVKITR